ncbi:myb family transcription factor EFM-like [Iris pallida]|uniref:Myb family transcription factor EFM-like n=1 Tax=Iris pallida TaxID=29817 RepID=A0AAX6ELH5_IRIPA|nr:myb family transcription factor EFM-like [Iris pallida]
MLRDLRKVFFFQKVKQSKAKMGPELGLDLKLSATAAAARIVGNLSRDNSVDQQIRISRLEQHIGSLEEERKKIEVFKRELPLCMHLLDDVILASKEKVEQWKKENMEQLMATNVKLEKESNEKMSWMSTAQLWSNNHNHNDNTILQQSAAESDRVPENPETTKKTVGGGAFLRKDDGVTGRSLDLSLVPAAADDDGRSSVPEPIASCHVSLPSSQQQQQAQRKARRCWSPELHRRFVASLQQLGGAQVATPKQIRELMKVDGLTNDEVKSHLQKYRIHTRGMPARGAGSHHRTGMMGGLWAEPESYPQSRGSPQGPLQLSGSSRAVSVTAGESCEDDSRSEGYNWK